MSPWFDAMRFENVHQIGGIQTALLPVGPGSAQMTHVAQVNTGSGLRFTVTLDRGGDIAEAFFNQHSLTYLTPTGVAPPSHAFHRGMDWLEACATV